MTTENYLILTICLLGTFPFCFGIALVICFISESIKEHRNDRRFYSEPYKVKDAKHLFCELYKNASEYEVFESVDFEGCYFIQKKFCSMGKGYQSSYRDFINDDIDTPVEDLQSMDETELKKLRHFKKAFYYKQRNMKKDDNADTPAS